MCRKWHMGGILPSDKEDPSLSRRIVVCLFHLPKADFIFSNTSYGTRKSPVPRPMAM